MNNPIINNANSDSNRQIQNNNQNFGVGFNRLNSNIKQEPESQRHNVVYDARVYAQQQNDLTKEGKTTSPDVQSQIYISQNNIRTDAGGIRRADDSQREKGNTNIVNGIRSNETPVVLGVKNVGSGKQEELTGNPKIETTFTGNGNQDGRLGLNSVQHQQQQQQQILQQQQDKQPQQQQQPQQQPQHQEQQIQQQQQLLQLQQIQQQQQFQQQQQSQQQQQFQQQQQQFQQQQQVQQQQQFPQQQQQQQQQTKTPELGGVHISWDWEDFSILFKSYGGAEMKVRRAPHPTTGEPWPLPQYYTKKDDKVSSTFISHYTSMLLSVVSDSMKLHFLLPRLFDKAPCPF